MRQVQGVQGGYKAGTKGVKWHKAGTRGARQVQGRYKGCQGRYKAGTRGMVQVQGRYKGCKVGMRQLQRVQGIQIVFFCLKTRGCCPLQPLLMPI